MNDSGIRDLVPFHVRRQWVSSGLYPQLSIYEAFRLQALAHPDKVAVFSSAGSISYAELDDLARRLARSLRERGLVAGDVVAYQLPNGWQCCAIDLAAAALGAVVAPFPPGRGRLDVESLLSKCHARCIIAPVKYAGEAVCEMIESLRPTILSLRILVTGSGESRPGWHSLDEMFLSQPLAPHELTHVSPDAAARFLVSSGTEAAPKLVAYSHNALLGGRGRFLQRLHDRPQDFIGFYLVPLGSAFGSSATAGVLAWLGGSIVALSRFDAREALQAIEKFRPTHVLGVPTMLQRMAADGYISEVDRSSLVALVSGGSSIDPESVKRCSEAFGCAFISLYGSADGVNCHNRPGDPLDVVLRSVGKPCPEVCEIKIVDEQRQEMPQGDVGKVAARGPMSAMQYVNAPDLDEAYRDGQGWVYTGDLGYIDEQGYLVLQGRKKDIIIRGGANISAVQIELLAASYPGVVSAACVPVADFDLGQRVCLYLTMADGAAWPSLAEMTSHMKAKGLEASKLPEYLRFVRQLPLTPAGKLDKRLLASQIAFLERAPAAAAPAAA